MTLIGIIKIFAALLIVGVLWVIFFRLIEDETRSGIARWFSMAAWCVGVGAIVSWLDEVLFLSNSILRIVVCLSTMILAYYCALEFLNHESERR